MDPEEIQGVDPQQLEEAAAAMEALIAVALAAVAVQAAAEILIPGIPLVDVDALSVIPTLWTVRAERDLIPALEVTIRIVTEMLRDEIDEALPLDFPLVPEISDTTAAQILAGARNRLVGIGDILWQNARTSLVEGVELGEDVPALAARVREAADVTVPRSRTIARTEVISASNASSIAQARSAGVGMEKGWLATEDDRTRPAHVLADGQWVPLDGMFDVGGELLDFPGDPEGRADNVINERCSIIYRITGMSPTVAAAGRHCEFERLDSFDANALELKFGRPVDTVTVGEEFEDDTQRLRIRIFPDGTSHLSNDVKGPNGEERFQPFTDQLTSDELREVAESLESAIDFDPDDYDEDDDDEDGIMAGVQAPDRVTFYRYRNGDIRLTRDAPVDPDEPDRSEMYLYDLGEDEQQDLLRELNEAADQQEELEASLEDDGEEAEEDLSEAIHLTTEGMGDVATIPYHEDGQVGFRFFDQPLSDMALDLPEAEAVSAALANARQAFDEAKPDSEVPFFSEELTFGPYSGMKLEGFNADGTFVFQMTGTGVLGRIGTISLEGDDPEEFENILDQALDAMADGPVTASSAVPHLHTCTEGSKVNGRWPPGPCKGWKNNLPAGDPRKGAPGAAKKPRAAAPRKRVLAPNDPGLTEGMNPAQRGQAEQAVVDRARSRGEMLAALSELVENDAPADVLAHRAGSLKRGLGDNADAAVDKVIAAAESGDKAKMRRAVKAAAKKWGLSQAAAFGKPLAFDPKLHRTFGGGANVRPADGEPVRLERPGFTFRDHEGNDLNLVKAVVSKDIAAAETPDTREDAARARQAKIDAARSRANVLAEVEELVLNETDGPVLARNIEKLAARLGVQDDPAIAGVIAAAGGDRDGLLQKVREAAGSFGLRRVGAPRQPFDPRQHQAIGDRPREGALVDLVRPGYTATIDGEQVLVEKAVVEKAEPGFVIAGARDYVRDGDGQFAETPGIDGVGGFLAGAVTGQGALDAVPAHLVDDGLGPLNPRHEQGEITWSGSDPGWDAAEELDHLLALEYYRGADFRPVNKMLRGVPYRATSQTDVDLGPEGFKARLDRQVQLLDDVVKRSRLDGDVVVARGTETGRGVFGPALDGDLTGFEWDELGYVSTTANPKIADYFTSQGLIMDIRVPKGTGVVSLSGMKRADGEEEEAELMLERGLRMRVVSDSGPGYPRKLEVEVIS